MPVGTAAASHLFDGHARARALGVVGAFDLVAAAEGSALGAAPRERHRLAVLIAALAVVAVARFLIF